MHLLDREHKVVHTAGEVAWDLVRDGITPGGDYVRLTDGPGGQPRFASFGQIVRTNPWLYAGIANIARGISRLPLELYAGGKGESQNIVKPDASTPAGSLALALAFPGSGTARLDASTVGVGQKALVHGTVWDKFTHGNALWYVVREGNPRSGTIVGFERVPWPRVSFDSDLMQYVVTDKGTSRRLWPEQVVHFGKWFGSGVINDSPVGALKKTIALYDAVDRYLVGWFNNGAHFSGVLEVDKDTREGTFEKIRDQIRRFYTGSDRAGQVLISSGKFHPMSGAPDNSKVVELAKASREEILAALGVPPPMAGILDNAIMSNVKELREHYLLDLIAPHSGFLESDFTAQVISQSPEAIGFLDVAFDVDEQLRFDLAARSAIFRDLLTIYTPNEVRALQRLERLPDESADRLWMPTNLVPLGAPPPDAGDGTTEGGDATEDQEHDEDFQRVLDVSIVLQRLYLAVVNGVITAEEARVQANKLGAGLILPLPPELIAPLESEESDDESV